MAYRDSTGSLTIDGIRIDFESASTLHGVDNPIGQMTFTVRTPLPAALTSGTGAITKRVVLTATQATHDGYVGTQRSNFRQEAGVIFTGTIRGNQFQSDPSGRTRTFRCQDDLWMFGVETYEPQAWNGPITGNVLIRGMLQSKGYGTGRRQAIYLDELRAPDNTGLSLGGNDFVDDGQVVLRDGSSQLALMRNIAEVYGFALYSLPTGNPRMSRVLGIPPSVGVTDLFRADGGYRVINSSDEGFSYRGGDDADEVTNYVEVFGASWQEDDGTGVDIRSFPASVALNFDLPEDVKVRHTEFSSPFILTQDQADGAREIRELDMGARSRSVTIEMDGMPTAYPGHVHKLVASDLGLNETYFVMTVVHSIDSRGGYRTTVTYRRGAGNARPAGVDKCVFRSLFTSPIHVGDEFVGWYAVPSPTSGVLKTYTFTPSVEQTALAFVARAHGCNSQWTIKPPPDGLTGSKILVEQLKAGGSTGVPADWIRVGDNELPVLDERYPEQRAYSNDANWVDVKLPIPGTIEAGRIVRVSVIAGTDGVGADDFELKNASLMSCEEGQPTLPAYPKPPVVVIPPRQEPGTTAPSAGTTPGSTPVRPARFLVRLDGTGRPGVGQLTATRELQVPVGATKVLFKVTATNLAAGTGTKGSTFSEYFQISLARPGSVTTLYGRLLNSQTGTGSAAAGSGVRSFSFDVTALVATQARTMVASATQLVTETNVITIDHWEAYVS